MVTGGYNKPMDLVALSYIRRLISDNIFEQSIKMVLEDANLIWLLKSPINPFTSFS